MEKKPTSVILAVSLLIAASVAKAQFPTQVIKPSPPPSPPSTSSHSTSSRRCASPNGATFIATADCWVGTRSDNNASWGVFQLSKGSRRVITIAAGKTLYWGTGPAGTSGQLEINYKGTVGRCDIKQVSGY